MVSPTVTPQMHLWNFTADRYLLGREAMTLQGLPWRSLPRISDFSESQLQDLAGNSFSSSISLAVDASLFWAAGAVARLSQPKVIGDRKVLLRWQI